MTEGTEENRRSNKVYSSLHSPLLIAGVERLLFVYLFVFSYLVFYATNKLMAGLSVAGVSLIAGRYLTKKDPHFMTIMINASMVKKVYDPMKFERVRVTLR